MDENLVISLWKHRLCANNNELFEPCLPNNRKRDSVQPSLIQKSGPHDLVGTRNVNFSAFCFIFNFRESPLHCFLCSFQGSTTRRKKFPEINLAFARSLHAFVVCLTACIFRICCVFLRLKIAARFKAVQTFKALKPSVGWMANF